MRESTARTNDLSITDYPSLDQAYPFYAGPSALQTQCRRGKGWINPLWNLCDHIGMFVISGEALRGPSAPLNYAGSEVAESGEGIA